MTKFKNFQASYKGDANLQITAFSDKNQKIVFLIDVENVSAYLMQVSQLGDLRKCIIKTLSYIEENRIKPVENSF